MCTGSLERDVTGAAASPISSEAYREHWSGTLPTFSLKGIANSRWEKSYEFAIKRQFGSHELKWLKLVSLVKL